MKNISAQTRALREIFHREVLHFSRVRQTHGDTDGDIAAAVMCALIQSTARYVSITDPDHQQDIRNKLVQILDQGISDLAAARDLTTDRDLTSDP